MDGGAVDYPGAFRIACARLGLPAVIDNYPHIEPHQFSRSKLAAIRARLERRHSSEVVCFCPGALEHFIDGPDVSFVFSAYGEWHDARRTAVIPHPWSPVRPETGQDACRWTGKPSLTIGFMGSAYANSRSARAVASGPAALRNWLKHGGLVRNVDRVAWLDEHHVRHRYFPTFMRFQALNAVKRAHRRTRMGQLEIVDTAGFDGSAGQIAGFAKHMQRMTYVLCPRGCENYSFRVFEALAFGRVPVIIDTDMVLPGSIDWQKVAIVVPFEQLDSIHDRIVRDHWDRSAADFAERQNAALAVSRYLSGDTWLSDEIRLALESRDLVDSDFGAERFRAGPEVEPRRHDDRLGSTVQS